MYLFHRIFPTSLWSKNTVTLWSATFLSIIYFYALWCLDSTFTSFSAPLTWINALLLATVLMIPQACFRLRWLQLSILLALSLWLESNVMYFRTYFTHIPMSSYALAGNLSDFGESVIDSMRWQDAGFLLILILALVFSGRTKLQSRLQGNDRLIYLGYAAVLLAISIAAFAIKGGFSGYWANLNNANYFTTKVPQYSLPGALLHDAMEHPSTLSPAMQAKVDRWMQSRPEMLPLSQVADSTARIDTVPRTSLVLLLCESLESWPIGLTLEGKEITPNLNRYVADSSALYAPQVLTQVGNGRSIDAQLLYNAGMLPMENDVYSFATVSNTFHTLTKAMAEQVGSRGYLLTVDKPVVWNQEVVARNFGIDTLISRNDWRKEELMGGRSKIGDQAFARQIVEKMRAGDIWPKGENAYIQIVTYSGHNPFRLPENLDSLHLQGNYPQLLCDYMTTAHYTDGAIATIVEYIKQRPDYDRTMIVIVGDHEGLASYRSTMHQECEWVDPRPMTPLVVINAPVGMRYDQALGQVDVYPTLLQLMGLTQYPWHGIGQSIFDPGYVSPDDDLQMSDKKIISDAMLRYDLLK